MTSSKNRGHFAGWWIALGAIILLAVFAGVLIWSFWNSTGTAYVN